jgi:hypothetical protein
MTTNEHHPEDDLGDADMILDAFDKVTVDDLVQAFRDWLPNAAGRGSFAFMPAECLSRMDNRNSRPHGATMTAHPAPNRPHAA